MNYKSNKISIVLFLIFLFGATFFMYGFLPLSYSNDDHSDYKDLPIFLDTDDIPLNSTEYLPKYSQMILMIIDAMRIDFLPKMDYVNKLVDEGNLCKINIKVQSPTVTMPRIKALTTGTVPNFVDIILNLGSFELKIDSILHQMYDKGGKLVFCGDNTWIKMFPGIFDRKLENHDSFFVNDFYEGDKNITQRLNYELRSPIDWKLLVLHYLGLDHIGHVEGPFSPKVPIKLREMDNVVSKIISSIDLWVSDELPTLFLITGDHGMRDTGGHGGSTYAEMNVPLIVSGGINCKSISESYHQIDITPTVSILFGLPIPSSSIGVIIPELINMLSNREQLYGLHYNSKRLYEKLSNSFDMNMFLNSEFYIQHREAIAEHKKYLTSLKDNHEEDKISFKKSKLLYSSSSRRMSDLLIKILIKYDVISIIMGLILLTTTSIVFILQTFVALNGTGTINIQFRLANFWLWSTEVIFVKYLLNKMELFVESMWFSQFLLSDFICIFYVFLIYLEYCIFKGIKQHLHKCNINLKTINNKIVWFMLFGILFHTLSLASSSFIEEEHQTWYYLMSTFIIILFIKDILYHKSEIFKFIERKSFNNFPKFLFNWFILIGSNIFLKKLNQTGDKWIHLSDIGDWLTTDENKFWLSVFVLIGLFGIVPICCGFNHFLVNVLTFTGTILIYYYRTITGMVLCPGVKISDSKTSLKVYWYNILEIIIINYATLLFKYKKRQIHRKDIRLCLSTNITIFCLISALLHKPHNIILNISIIIYCCFFNGILKTHFTPRIWQFTTIILHYWIGKTFYFYQGNSNNLSTIDLNAGYIGLTNFNFLSVGFFVILNTYNGLILSYLVLIYNLYDCHDSITLSSSIPQSVQNIKDKKDDDVDDDDDDAIEQKKSTKDIEISQNTSSIFLYFILQVIIPFTYYCFIVLLFRHHLFIWTVFSPKLLYKYFHLCLVFLILLITYFF